MKYLGVIFISLISVGLSAQDKKMSDSKYELGINLYNITDYENRYMFWRNNKEGDFVHQFITGIMFKRNWDEKALRISLDYFYKSADYDKLIYTFNGGAVHQTQSCFLIENRIGYEHQFLTFGNFKPYIGADFIMGYEVNKNEMTGTDFAQPPYHFYNQYDYLRIGLATILGIKYQISPRFSANIETSLGIIGTFLIKDNKTESQGGDYNFKPIRLLSINYHFKIR